MKYVVAWLVLACSLLVLCGSVNWLAFYRIDKHGVRTNGKVVGLLAQTHQMVEYDYSVQDQTYHGRMQSWPPNPPLEKLSKNEEVIVFYDPQKPGKSVLGNPGPILENETKSVILAATLLPTFCVLAWSWRAKGRRPR